MIEINVYKNYDDRVVLNIQSFSFEEGKKYALIGANGCGKSTLLKILDSQLTYKGKIITSAKSIGYMPQSTFAFDSSLKSNVFANIPDLKKFNPKEHLYYTERCHKLIYDMGLSPLKYKNATKLSGGETQRMGLCRLLVKKYDLLLLDEPTSAMDINATEIAENVLKDYYNENHPTIIFATHSLTQAERMADIVLFFKDGKIIETIDAKELLTNPKSEDLKEFLNKA